MRMCVWSSEVSYINSTPFFRLKIVSTNVKMYKCTTTLLYIVFKKGDIIMTLGNDNAGNWSKCVMLCSVNMICIYIFHFFVVYIYSFMQMFHKNCSITLYITVNKKMVIFRSKTVYTGPLPQLYGSFCTFFNWDLFKLLFCKHFL
jgi:hypothetical protein